MRNARGISGIGLRLAAMAAACCASLAGAVAASAEVGSLRQLGEPSPACVTEVPVDNCTHADGLPAPYRSAISKDGKSVFTVSPGPNSTLAAFQRNTTTGALTLSECLVQTGSPVGRCAGIAPGLGGASDVAVSPDGKNVYVASATEGAVAVLGRSGAFLNQLGPGAGCWSETGLDGCSDGRGLTAPDAIVVSPDGKFVYVGSEDRGIAAFSRNTTTGVLSQLAGTAGCVNTAGDDGCARATAVNEIVSLAISPDGKSLYASDTSDGAVSAFARNTTTGALTQLPGTAGCVRSGNPACRAGNGLTLADNVVVSHDGKSVYVLSQLGDVAVFARQTTTTGGLLGALSQLPGASACATREGTGCGGSSLTGSAFGLAISADGKSVYETGLGESVVQTFTRQTTTTNGLLGALTPETVLPGCWSESDSTCEPARGLAHATDVDVSADGKTVYVTGQSEGIAAFTRSTEGTLKQLDFPPAACASGNPFEVPTCSVANQLAAPAQLAISKDGKSVYAASPPTASLELLARNTTTGVVSEPTTLGGCAVWTSLPTPAGCVGGIGLADASDVAVSPDGKYVYAGGGEVAGVNAIAWLPRNTTSGLLATNVSGSGGCIAQHGTSSVCTATGVGLAGPTRAIAISPDGKSLYLASSVGVAAYQRNATTGALTAVYCAPVSAGLGCSAARGLSNPTSVAVSANGKSVYVTSSTSNAVAVFSRQTTTANGEQGTLTELPGTAGCVEQAGGTDGCGVGHGLTGAKDIALSADGKSAYVVGSSGGVETLARQTAGATLGALTETGCESEPAAGTCTAARGIANPGTVAVSPDGKSVYVASQTTASVGVFARATSGTLTQLGGFSGCEGLDLADSCSPWVGIVGQPTDVAVTPDNNSVYISSSDGEVGAFARATK